MARKRARKLNYRLVEERHEAFASTRIAVRFVYKWHDVAAQ